MTTALATSSRNRLAVAASALIAGALGTTMFGSAPPASATCASFFGLGNTVSAGPGPVAISVALLRSNSNITKSGPGFNINGVVVGGASAVSGKKAGSKNAASSKSGGTSSAKSTGGSARS